MEDATAIKLDELSMPVESRLACPVKAVSADEEAICRWRSNVSNALRHGND